MACRIVSLVLVSLVFGMSGASAQCIKPEPDLVIPDGATVPEDEMLAAYKLFKAYDSRLTTFVECLNVQEQTVLRAKAAELDEEDLQAIAARYAEQRDAAIDEAEALAAKFNEQIRAFKARDDGRP